MKLDLDCNLKGKVYWLASKFSIVASQQMTTHACKDVMQWFLKRTESVALSPRGIGGFGVFIKTGQDSGFIHPDRIIQSSYFDDLQWP